MDEVSLLSLLDSSRLDPSQRLQAYKAIVPLLQSLPESSLVTSLPSFLPHLLVSRYYGPEVQRWPSHKAWRDFVGYLEALPAFANLEAPAEDARSPPSPLLLAVQAGMALVKDPGGGSISSRGSAPVSPSAAAAMAPGAEGSSRLGRHLLSLHAAHLGETFTSHLASASATVHDCIEHWQRDPADQAGILALHAAVLDAEAMVNVSAEFAVKAHPASAAPYALGVLHACKPLQWVQAGLASQGPPQQPQRAPAPWIPPYATPHSALANLSDSAIVCCGKVLSTFHSSLPLGELEACVGEWVGALGDSAYESCQRPFREHCAMATGFALAVHASPHELAKGVCVEVERRLSSAGIASPLPPFFVQEMEGGLFLMRELAAVVPELASPLIPLLSSLAARSIEVCTGGGGCDESEGHFRLLESLWRCMGDVSKGVGRLETKRHLDALLPPLSDTATLASPSIPPLSPSLGGGGMERVKAMGKAQLCRAARLSAMECAQVLAVVVGKSIFSARLSPSQGHLAPRLDG
jgi:hypothetical protein